MPEIEPTGVRLRSSPRAATATTLRVPSGAAGSSMPTVDARLSGADRTAAGRFTGRLQGAVAAAT